jgi:hypothetical protein
MTNFNYNSNAILVLAEFKSSGHDVTVNRKQALSIIRDMLSGLTLAGNETTIKCPLLPALGKVVDVTLLSEEDGKRVRLAFHRLIGLSS